MAGVKKLSLKDWVEQNGGPAKVSRLLKIRESAIRHWTTGRVLPKDEMKLKIKKISGDVVESADDMIERHFSATNKNRWTG